MRSLERLERVCEDQFCNMDPELCTEDREKKAFTAAFRVLYDDMERTERIAALRHFMMGRTFRGLGEAPYLHPGAGGVGDAGGYREL